MRKEDYETVVIDGEFSLKNVIDGEVYEVQKVSKNYEVLINKPQINSVELIGNKTFEELGLVELDGDDLIRILKD